MPKTKKTKKSKKNQTQKLKGNKNIANQNLINIKIGKSGTSRKQTAPQQRTQPSSSNVVVHVAPTPLQQIHPGFFNNEPAPRLGKVAEPEPPKFGGPSVPIPPEYNGNGTFKPPVYSGNDSFIPPVKIDTYSSRPSPANPKTGPFTVPTINNDPFNNNLPIEILETGPLQMEKFDTSALLNNFTYTDDIPEILAYDRAPQMLQIEDDPAKGYPNLYNTSYPDLPRSININNPLSGPYDYIEGFSFPNKIKEPLLQIKDDPNKNPLSQPYDENVGFSFDDIYDDEYDDPRPIIKEQLISNEEEDEAQYIEPDESNKPITKEVSNILLNKAMKKLESNDMSNFGSRELLNLAAIKKHPEYENEIRNASGVKDVALLSRKYDKDKQEYEQLKKEIEQLKPIFKKEVITPNLEETFKHMNNLDRNSNFGNSYQVSEVAKIMFPAHANEFNKLSIKDTVKRYRELQQTK